MNKRLQLSKTALFDHVGYFPHDGQDAVHKSTAAYRVLACGARWGKSTCASMEAVAAMLEPCEASIGWVVAPTYDLCNRVFQRVEELVRSRFRHRLIEVNARERKIVVVNLGGGKSELRAKSGDNPTSLLGEGLSYVIVDEAARLKREVWESHLAQRLVDRLGWALLLSTPRGLNWFHAMYRRGQRSEPGFASWASPSWQNPSLDKAVIEAERNRLKPDAFAQEYGAEFIGAQLEPCEVCGGPNPEAKGIFVCEQDYEVPLCPECSEPVDADGRTLVRKSGDGEGELKIIRLAPYPEQEPEPVAV